LSTASYGFIPGLTWLRQHRSEWLRPDVTAGLTAAAVVIPKAMAYATIAGLYALGRKRGTQVFRALTGEHPDDETWPGLLILRTEGRLFFANAQRVSEKMRLLVDQAKPRVMVLDCSAVIDVEYTAVKMFTEAEERLRGEGIIVWLAALNPEVLAVMQRSKLGTTLGRERMFFNLQAAVERYERDIR